MNHARDLVARDRASVWHPYTQMQTAPDPLPIARGEGVYLYTEDGRRILDGISSWWVNIHGHAHPRLNAALTRQAQQIEQVIFAGCTHRPAVDLAERLRAVLPAGLTRVFYSDNGSTAVEVALKLAYQYWQNRGEPRRRQFVTLLHAYHGDTIGAMSVSEACVFTAPFQPLLFPVARVPSPYCYRCPVGLTRASCRIDCLGGLEEHLRAHRGTVAGVLIEPMLQGAGGMIVWPAEFLAGVRRLCDEYDTLMIADEVFTGFGRTGRMFACEHAAVTPDVICLSKALTAGYLPLGATVTTDALYDTFLSEDRAKAFFHGHSFTANPLACAVALASLDLFAEQDLLSRVRALERQLQAGLEPLRALPVVGDVRVLGGVGIVELTETPEASGQAGYLNEIGPPLAQAFIDRGLLLRPLGNVLYFVPPYVITEAETDWALGQIAEVLQEIADRQHA
ncbi:MAG TPA: adenosylmethionine--8-amino-7-oxononanoate transaminase [Vicinamibacterales bacterium]|nr:adenosylmethionine--8-amino-7-oxononanoate transaminase [Vicinamibacterales bacterium]